MTQRMLIVDDEKDHRLMVISLLEVLVGNLDIIPVISGEEGLKIVQSNILPDSERKLNIDLIVLDLRLPKMDGFAFLKEVRSIDTDIPVIIITADIMKRADELNALKQNDVNVYVYPKPIGVLMFVTNVRKLLKRPAA